MKRRGAASALLFFFINFFPVGVKMSKAKLEVMAYALVAFAAVSFIQRNVFAVPFVGGYLPK